MKMPCPVLDCSVNISEPSPVLRPSGHHALCWDAAQGRLGCGAAGTTQRIIVVCAACFLLPPASCYSPCSSSQQLPPRASVARPTLVKQ